MECGSSPCPSRLAKQSPFVEQPNWLTQPPFANDNPMYEVDEGCSTLPFLGIDLTILVRAGIQHSGAIKVVLQLAQGRVLWLLWRRWREGLARTATVLVPRSSQIASTRQRTVSQQTDQFNRLRSAVQQLQDSQTAIAY